MKLSNLLLASLSVVLLNGCASSYKNIDPKTLNYNSISSSNGVSLAYKYDLLDKKYKKKEANNEMKLVAVKIINSTERDLVFGNDLKLTYENGSELYLIDNNMVFKTIKQNTASYLWYLLLTPLNLYTTQANSNGTPQQTSSTPIGLVVGPGLAAGNIIAANNANTKFKNDLQNYNIIGSKIKKGEIVYGLIGVKSRNYDALKLKLDEAITMGSN
jgi:hypothetical protein